MDVRVMGKILSPSVEHGQNADLGTKVCRISRDLQQRLRGSTKEEAIDETLVLQCEWGDLKTPMKTGLKSVLATQRFIARRYRSTEANLHNGIKQHGVKRPCPCGKLVGFAQKVEDYALNPHSPCISGYL